MRYSGVLLKTNQPLGELAERIGALLGLKFSRTAPHFAGRHRRIFTLSEVEWPQRSTNSNLHGYRIELLVNGDADRARLRNAREAFCKLRALGVPLTLLDRDVTVVENWEPQQGAQLAHRVKDGGERRSLVNSGVCEVGALQPA